MSTAPVGVHLWAIAGRHVLAGDGREVEIDEDARCGIAVGDIFKGESMTDIRVATFAGVVDSIGWFATETDFTSYRANLESEITDLYAEYVTATGHPLPRAEWAKAEYPMPRLCVLHHPKETPEDKVFLIIGSDRILVEEAGWFPAEADAKVWAGPTSAMSVIGLWPY